MLETLTLFFTDTFNWLVAQGHELFFNPEKRVFIGYLLSAFAIAILWMVRWQKRSIKSSLKKLFSKKLWLSGSAKADYKLMLINRILLGLLSPYLVAQLAIGLFLFEQLHAWFTPKSGQSLPYELIVVLFTFTLFIFDDFSKYLLHRWMHTYRWLWVFHQVHHSATRLTPLTIFRTHPVEMVLFSLRSAVVQGIVVGVFVFFFGGQLELITVFGANVAVFAFNVLGANLRHSEVPIAYPDWLEKWLMSPAQHQVHHSIEEHHYNKNFGVILSVWDRLGGSWYRGDSQQKLKYGLGEQPVDTTHNLKQLYIAPFKKLL